MIDEDIENMSINSNKRDNDNTHPRIEQLESQVRKLLRYVKYILISL